MIKPSRSNSIKNNLIVYTLGIIMLMTILSIYSLSILERYKDQIETMFEKHIYLSQVQQKMIELDENLLGFLTSKNSTKLNNYNISSQQLQLLLNKNSSDIYIYEDLMLKNIRNLTDEYIKFGNEAITFKRQRNINNYYESYNKGKIIKSYIQDYIDISNNLQLSYNSMEYMELVNQIYLLQTITYAIILLVIVISLLIVYLITSRMSKPFSQLSYAAEEIAKGNFDMDDLQMEQNDEFTLLAIAFNKMKNNINDYVNELKRKTEMEVKLKDEQMKNLKMEHLLDNARLYALQSQINPHFLFNTINAGVQLSIMERAPRTGGFLESMSKLFRYNIQKMDSVCTLEDEIKNITDYYNLLKVRFGDRIQFELDADTLTLNKKVPPLILQPLVENAYVHGLSGLEEGGTIKVTTLLLQEEVLVVIKDDGRGMDEAEIEKMMSREILEDNEIKTKIKKQGGIGVKNVRDRLELFFHQMEIIEIESELNEGVEILIHLPNKIME